MQFLLCKAVDKSENVDRVKSFGLQVVQLLDENVQGPWRMINKFKSGRHLAGCTFVGGVLAVLLFRAALPAKFAVNESTDYVRFYEPVGRRILAGNGLTPRTVRRPSAIHPSSML